MRVCYYYIRCSLLLVCFFVFFFFKQKTAYEMRISDWSSDVCSSDLAKRAASLRASARTVLHAKARRRPLYPAPNRSPAKAGVQGRNHHARRRLISAAARRRADDARVVPSAEPATNHVSSEESRLGKECLLTCSYRSQPHTEKKETTVPQTYSSLAT